MKRMHTEQEIKELAQEQITQSPTIAELQAKIGAIDSKANVFEFEGSVEDLDADALAALYESKAQIIKFDTEIETVFYCDVFTNLEMRFFNLSQNKYTYFEAERATTDDSWYVGDTAEKTILFDGNINLNGSFTADSIIENMEGYRFSSGAADANVTVENIYAGAVKNGNKLTLVLFGKIIRTGTSVNGWIQTGIFTLPKAVADKIIPTNIGVVANAVNSDAIQLFKAQNSFKVVPSVSRKQSDTKIDIILYSINDLDLNEEYQFRSQITFLLSNNLASNNP